jgi:hypothetical protein
MPTTTEHGFWKMGSDLEGADLYKVSTETSDSVERVMCPDYTNVTYSGAWADYGSDAEETSYAKEGHRVFLRGTAAHATAGQLGTIFVLPIGYRPAKDRFFVVSASAGIALIKVDNSTGAVSVVSYLAGGGADDGVSLDPVNFDTAP